MITNETSGVWELWDAYAKRNAERWVPDGANIFSFGGNGFGYLGINDRAYY